MGDLHIVIYITKP